MWFCHECSVPASQIIRNVSVIQKRQDIIEDEVKQMGKRMNAAEAKIEQNKREADNHMKDHESGIQELKKQVRELDVKLHFIEDEVAANGENQKWSDIVNKAVDSKLEVVSAGINRS